jgi:pimeloyl-ACP methyl ester carboxylesterase
MKSIPDNIVTEEMRISSDTAGIELFVRNKRRSGMATFASERTILFVAGSTYPASTSFDLGLDGLSWMDHLADQGYDVYLVDIRGYGRSSRPPEMTHRPAITRRSCGRRSRCETSRPPSPSSDPGEASRKST